MYGSLIKPWKPISRLFNLTSNKGVVVNDLGKWVNDVWVWEWDWIPSPWGRSLDELDDLVDALTSVNISPCLNLRVSWIWNLDKEGMFIISCLKLLIKKKLFLVSDLMIETQWLKIIPRKLIFLSRGVLEIESQFGLPWSIATLTLYHPFAWWYSRINRALPIKL